MDACLYIRLYSNKYSTFFERAEDEDRIVGYKIEGNVAAI